MDLTNVVVREETGLPWNEDLGFEEREGVRVVVAIAAIVKGFNWIVFYLR